MVRIDHTSLRASAVTKWLQSGQDVESCVCEKVGIPLNVITDIAEYLGISYQIIE